MTVWPLTPACSINSRWVPPGNLCLCVASDTCPEGRVPDHDNLLNQDPPSAILLGREVLHVDAEAGEVALRYTAREDFANRHGTVQGGFLAAMLDSATGLAVVAGLPAEMTAVTSRLDVTFIRPAGPGPLLATARIVRRDDRSADVQGNLTDEGGIVLATAKAELRILSRRR